VKRRSNALLQSLLNRLSTARLASSSPWLHDDFVLDNLVASATDETKAKAVSSRMNFIVMI